MSNNEFELPQEAGYDSVCISGAMTEYLAVSSRGYSTFGIHHSPQASHRHSQHL